MAAYLLFSILYYSNTLSTKNDNIANFVDSNHSVDEIDGKPVFDDTIKNVNHHGSNSKTTIDSSKLENFDTNKDSYYKDSEIYDYSKPAYIDEMAGQGLPFKEVYDTTFHGLDITVDEKDPDNFANHNKKIIDEIDDKSSKLLNSNKISHPGNDKRLKLIKNLFDKLIKMVELSKPTTGFKLDSDNELDEKHPSLKLFNKEYGTSGKHDMSITDKETIVSKKFLSNSLHLPDEMFEDLRKSHKTFVDNMIEAYSEGTYKGDGILFIAGDKFSWLSLLGIENLRNTGSKLPIEVVIPQSYDYEYELCEKVLPKLNAKCILLYELYPKMENISGYQYKILSLFASSFERILFLDSDNIPVANPDIIFDSDLFKSKNLILWPDFWKRVTHPKFYEIGNYKIGKERVRYVNDKVTPIEVYTNESDDLNIDIPLHDIHGTIPDSSTESGQLIINKKTHFKALLLSFYYNSYGPRQYYPLFSQGRAGEGDKETFAAGAIFFGLPFYQVNQQVNVIGHSHNNEYRGVGMIQFDPIIDELNEKRYKLELKDRMLLPDYQFNPDDFWNFFNKKISKPMFFHSNFPKFDPIGLINNKKFVDENDGHQYRMCIDQPNIGFDFELLQWTLINKYFCTADAINFKYLNKANISKTKLCDAIEKRVNYLKLSTYTTE